MEKLRKAEFIAGTDKIIAANENELGDEFDPDAYDRTMKKIFDDEYYNVDNDNADLTGTRNIDEALLGDKELKINDKAEQEENEDEAIGLADKLAKKPISASSLNNNAEDVNDDDQWWVCDGNLFMITVLECRGPINEGKMKFDCVVCDNFTLCKPCLRAVNHGHQMKKSKVPAGCNVCIKAIIAVAS